MPTEAWIGYLWSMAMAIPLIVALFRIRNIDPDYYPFLMYLALGVLVENLRMGEIYLYFRYKRFPDFLLYNLYVLGVCWLFLWQFRNWGFFDRYPRLFLILGISMTVIWLGNHLAPGQSLREPTKIYRFCYSLLLSLMAVSQMNRLIVSEKGSLLTNAAFLICCGIVLFFVPYIIIEAALFFEKNASREYQQNVAGLRPRINLLVFLIYTFAILWMPPKKKFIHPF